LDDVAAVLVGILDAARAAVLVEHGAGGAFVAATDPQMYARLSRPRLAATNEAHGDQRRRVQKRILHGPTPQLSCRPASRQGISPRVLPLSASLRCSARDHQHS